MKIARLALLVLLVVSFDASAHPLPDAAPFGAPRAFQQLDVNAWSLHLSVGESFAFSEADVVISFWTDDSEVLSVQRTDPGTVTFKANKPGKAFVGFIWKFDTPEAPTPDQMFGIDMARETFVVLVHEA